MPFFFRWCYNQQPSGICVGKHIRICFDKCCFSNDGVVTKNNDDNVLERIFLTFFVRCCFLDVAVTKNR